LEDIANNESVQCELAFLSKKILELNKKLIESEKAKSRFLSLVANELNNPMTVLLGMIPHLKILDDTQNKKIFDLVHYEALNLDFRIQNLVMAAEIESGTVDITYALLEPEDIIDEVCESLKYLIKEKNIQINVKSTIKQKVVSDPKKIYMIVKNLISNGCQYGIENGVIDITLDTNNSILRITVKNQGEGPKVDYKPEIFTRFAKDTKGEHGLGIGLSIVRELCERLDGGVDYVVEDGFITFIVTLLFDESMIDSQAYGSNEFLFDSFDNAIEL
jgi:signal transduction histidine kinase